MTAQHIAAQIRSAYQDGIRIARSKGRTLTVPVMGSHQAAEQIIRDTAAIGQEHGETFLRVYQGMVALTLNNAQTGRGAFLTTGKITAAVNEQTVTGRIISQDEIRPILLRLASDGAVIAGGYGWIVTAFTDRHPSETRAAAYKGKAPVNVAPTRITAGDIFGRPTPTPTPAAPVVSSEWEPDFTGWDAQPDTTGDDGYYDPQPPVTRATSDEWEPRPNVAPVVPTVTDRRTASERAGHAVAASITPDGVAAILRQVLTPEVLTRHLMTMPRKALATLIERATAPAAPVTVAPVTTPAAPTRTRRPAGRTLRTTTPTS